MFHLVALIDHVDYFVWFLFLFLCDKNYVSNYVER